MRKLAVIKDVNFGVGDYGKTALWFSLYTDKNSAALHVEHDLTKIAQLIEKAGVSDVKRLEGKTAWVEEGNGLIKFLELSTI